MGNVGIPKLSQSALADSGMSEQRKKYTAFMQALGAQGLPLNLDAWDGYPACRDRIAKMLAEAKANTVALAGDTHNAWAFDLNDSEQRSIGVEVGTPGISSPGMENYLPVPGKELAQALKDASPGLVDVDTSRRGWSEITLTPQAMRNRWHFVSTVLDRRFDVQSSPELVCLAGERRFS
jgi:alkaline phosphatase D